jgi:hypothetical protein
VPAVPSRHLYVILDEESRRRVAACALLPIVKGDHVTLAYAAPLDARLTEYIDGPWREGDELELHAVAEYASDEVQAWLIELSGSSRRKHDGGALHVTVSRSATARSRDANALLAAGHPVPRAEVLRGTLRWVSAEPENPEPAPET